jgi:excisionase family DNA binding protein
VSQPIWPKKKGAGVAANPSKNLERETGFEPATLSLGNGFTGSPEVHGPSQALATTGVEFGAGVQPSQPAGAVREDFATPSLPENGGRHARSEQFLTVREVARRLRVSTATVYKLCARGGLAHVRVLNVLRIPAAAIQVMATRGHP